MADVRIDVSKGVTSKNLTIGSGTILTVMAGGTVVDTLITAGGKATVISGASAKGTFDIQSGGSAVFSGAATQVSVQGGGILSIDGECDLSDVRQSTSAIINVHLDNNIKVTGTNASGVAFSIQNGTMTDFILVSGARVDVASNCSAVNLEQQAGGIINVNINKDKTSIAGINASGNAFSLANGVAENFILYTGGVMNVSGAVSVNNTEIVGGAMSFFGGILNGLKVYDAGKFYFVNGGTATNLEFESGAGITLQLGDSAAVLSGTYDGKAFLISKNVMSGFTCGDDAYIFLSGGAVVDTEILEGGTFFLGQDVVATNLVVKGGDLISIDSSFASSGPSIVNIQALDGTVSVCNAKINGGIIFNGGSLFIPNGVASNVDLSGGYAKVSRGSAYDMKVIGSDSQQAVLSVCERGYAENLGIYSKGFAAVLSGAKAYNVSVYESGGINIGTQSGKYSSTDVVSGLDLNYGASAYLRNSAVVVDADVASGAILRFDYDKLSWCQLSGAINFESGAIVYGAGAQKELTGVTIDFTLATQQDAAKALVSGWDFAGSDILSGANFTLTVSDQQLSKAGSYKLADNISAFNADKTITIKNTSGTVLCDNFSINSPYVVGDMRYVLVLDEVARTLSMVVTGDVPPTISIEVQPDPTQWTKEDFTVTATFTDEFSMILSKQYSFDNKTWQDYTTALTISENTPVYFRAESSTGKVATDSVVIDHIDKIAPTITVNTAPFSDTVVEISADFIDQQSGINDGTKKFSLDGKQTWVDYEGSFTVDVGSVVYFSVSDNVGNYSEVEYSTAIPTKYLEKLEIKESVAINENYYGLKKVNIAKNIIVSGCNWETCDKSATFTVGDNSIISIFELVAKNSGQISVSLKNNVALRVNGKMSGVSKLSTGNDALVIVDKFFGTTGNDSISFGKNASVTVNSVDLKGGKDSLSFGAYALVTVEGDIATVNKLTVANGSAADTKKKIAAQYSTLTAKNIVGGDNADTLQFGNYNRVNVEEINLAGGASGDTVKLGDYSELNAAAIKFSNNAKSKSKFTIGKVASATIKGKIENVNTLSAGDGSAAKDGKVSYTELVVSGGVTGSVNADTFSFGKYAKIEVDDEINTKTGNDTIKVGEHTQFEAMAINFGNDGKNTLSFGNFADANVAEISNVNKLTVGNGSATKDGKVTYSELTASGSVTGSVNADTFSFGNYAKVEIASVNTGNGNDTIKLGNNSLLDVEGEINFGTDKNTLSLGNVASANVAGIGNVNKLTVGNGSAAKDGKVTYAELTASGAIIGSVNADTFSFGNYAKVKIASSVNTGNGNDTIKLGNNSLLNVDGDINFGADKNTLSLGKVASASVAGISNVNKITVGNGSATKDGKVTYSELTATAVVSGSVNADTFSFGNYNKVNVGDISTGVGNDTIKIGDHTEFKAGVINFGDGKNTLTLGKVANATISSVENVNKLTVGNGVAAKGKDIEYSRLVVEGNILGTTGADTISFGDYNRVNVGSIAMGAGNDKLTIGKNSTVTINGALTGVETVTLGADSVLFLGAGTNIGGKLTGGSGNWLSLEADAYIDQVDLGSKNGNIVNLTAFREESGDRVLFSTCKNVNAIHWRYNNDTTIELGTAFDLGDGRQALLLQEGNSIRLQWSAIAAADSLDSNNESESAIFKTTLA